MPRVLSSAGRVLALGLILGHLFVVALAWFPSLHHWVHGDSDEPDHHCAVTAMLDGQLDRCTVPPVAAVPPVLLCGQVLLPDASPSPLLACGSGLHDRGPPSA